MTDSQTPTYRSHTTPDTPKSRYHEASGRSIELREDVEGEDGVFQIRMPIATTGEVRNQNDDPLTREELDGMAQQIGTGVVSVFPDHGKTDIGGPTGYSIMEKGGEWEGAEVVSAQDAESEEDELVATARLMDPDTLSDIPVRDMVGTIKELVKRDMSIPSSIGWKKDENAPGGNDLMEASMVGIGADPRTVSSGGDAATVARAAVEAGADREQLVATVREAVGGERDSEATQDMTDDDTGDDAGTTDDEQNAQDADEEFREFMREQTEQQTEILQSLADALREDDEDDDEEEEGDTDDDEEDEEDEEQSADADASETDTDEEQSVDEELTERVAELESMLDEARENGFEGVESPAGDADTDEEQSGEDTSTATTETWGRHRN